MEQGFSLRSGLVAVALGAMALGACVGTGVDTYEEFQSAIEGGADCEQLFEMRTNFDSRKDLDRIDADLQDLGCDGPGSTRSDV